MASLATPLTRGLTLVPCVAHLATNEATDLAPVLGTNMVAFVGIFAFVGRCVCEAICGSVGFYGLNLADEFVKLEDLVYSAG